MRWIAGILAAAACGNSTLDLGHGADAGGAPDASAVVTCESTCDRVIACKLARDDQRAQCLAECAGTPATTLECVAATPCASIPSACAPSSSPVDSGLGDFQTMIEIQQCQEACDSLKFFGCLDASQLTSCRSACETAKRDARSSFASCASSPAHDCDPSIGKPGTDCYRVFVGD